MKGATHEKGRSEEDKIRCRVWDVNGV